MMIYWERSDYDQVIESFTQPICSKPTNYAEIKPLHCIGYCSISIDYLFGRFFLFARQKLLAILFLKYKHLNNNFFLKCSITEISLRAVRETKLFKSFKMINCFGVSAGQNGINAMNTEETCIITSFTKQL